ncbi:MAG: ABC transporter ATP-binding protein [Proteobacteria bacterium]|nr:MAG: ABC transporter ATP-binding protein [Pseudomonadota bacterium]
MTERPLLHVRGIRCAYGAQIVVDSLSIHVNRGAIVGLLGPSGCGKTTALRAIAGFEPVLAGEIELGGELISRVGYSLAPEKRRLGMVFQDYALFPHLDVADNVIFGLRHQPTRNKRTTAEEMLETVGLAGYGARYPHELSGGQQQRVALARALAPRPELLLMDEPFSSLDVDLRERLSLEVRDILKRQGISAILVTHDQHEAFAICEQVGVMHEGQIHQWDTPFNLYHEPATRFVADFVGQGVLLKATVASPDTLETELGVLSGNRAYPWKPGTAVEVLLRPDDVTHDPTASLRGIVRKKAFKGAETLYTLELPNGDIVLSLLPSHLDYDEGEHLGVRITTTHLVAFAAY